MHQITARMLLRPGNFETSEKTFLASLPPLQIFGTVQSFWENKIFGKTIVHIDDRVILFEACEYCGSEYGVSESGNCLACGAGASGASDEKVYAEIYGAK